MKMNITQSFNLLGTQIFTHQLRLESEPKGQQHIDMVNKGISTITASVCVEGLNCTGSGSIRKEKKVSVEHRALFWSELRSGPRDSAQHCLSFV